VIHSPHGVSLWKNIRSGWDKFERFIISKLAMVLEQDFGMTLGVGTLLSRLSSQICTVLPVIRKLL
jgi:hypothetical protein